MATVRKPGESLVQGPTEEDGGFVMIGPSVGVDEIDDTPRDDAPELALGSDVHDVEDLERRLGVDNLDEMLQAYLADEPERRS